MNNLLNPDTDSQSNLENNRAYLKLLVELIDKYNTALSELNKLEQSSSETKDSYEFKYQQLIINNSVKEISHLNQSLGLIFIITILANMNTIQ